MAKRRAIITAICSFLLLLASLSGCAQAQSQAAASPQNTPSSISAASDNALVSPAPTPMPSIAPTVSPTPEAQTEDENSEPPMTAKDLAVATPDFLSDEQKSVYRRAYKFFLMFRVAGNVIDSEQFFPLKPGDSPAGQPDADEFILYKTVQYYPAHGRYRKYDYFLSSLEAVFTEEYADFICTNGDTIPAFLNVDGNTYYIGSERGYNPLFDAESTPVSFEKSYQDDTALEFNVCVAYPRIVYDTATDETTIDGTETVTYPIRMELTENGWRISEFEVPY